jgi:digeranylgeranylglycerophospholipid reductase
LDYDIVIAGGGPIGSRLASKLSSAGYKILVLEKKPNIGDPVCCTGIVSRECVETFNISPDIVLHNVSGARLISPSGITLNVQRPDIQVCILDRAALDSEMANRARLAGTVYSCNSIVEHVDYKRDYAIINFPEGITKQTVTAKCFVMANGFSGRTLRLSNTDGSGDFAIGVQAEVETSGTEQVEVYFDRQVAPGFFAWLVPLSSQKALIGLIARRNAVIRLRTLLESLLTKGKIKSAAVKVSSRILPLQPLKTTCGNRFLITGAAAGQVKPLTGGGIYYGLLCADIAAATLQKALSRDDFSAQCLTSYEKEWHRLLGEDIRISYRARRIYERLSNSQIDWFFNKLQVDGNTEKFLGIDGMSFDWHGNVIKAVMKETTPGSILRRMIRPLSGLKNNSG